MPPGTSPERLHHEPPSLRRTPPARSAPPARRSPLAAAHLRSACASLLLASARHRLAATRPAPAARAEPRPAPPPSRSRRVPVPAPGAAPAGRQRSAARQPPAAAPRTRPGPPLHAPARRWALLRAGSLGLVLWRRPSTRRSSFRAGVAPPRALAQRASAPAARVANHPSPR
jgi:hypothetical protein